MKFSRQEYWSGLPFSLPGDLPDPGIEPTSLASPAWAGRFFTTVPPGKPVATVPGGTDSALCHLESPWLPYRVVLTQHCAATFSTAHDPLLVRVMEWGCILKHYDESKQLHIHTLFLFSLRTTPYIFATLDYSHRCGL